MVSTGVEARKTVYFVDDVLVNGVKIILEMDFVRFAIQEPRMNDVDDRWNKMIESGNKIIQILGEMVIQQKKAANIDQLPLQEISIQDMEDLKQHYLDEMKSLINDIQIKDYRNKKIDIRYKREYESMIYELKGKFNGI
nr:hypothetical protein [Tanacetum cinerariifolium]